MNAPDIQEFNLQETLSPNRFTGLWRLMRGYRSRYLVSTLSLGISATTWSAKSSLSLK
jgi:hypothetical protein